MMAKRVAILKTLTVEVIGQKRPLGPPTRVVFSMCGSIGLIADLAAVFVKHGRSVETAMTDEPDRGDTRDTGAAEAWKTAVESAREVAP